MKASPYTTLAHLLARQAVREHLENTRDTLSRDQRAVSFNNTRNRHADLNGYNSTAGTGRLAHETGHPNNRGQHHG